MFASPTMAELMRLTGVFSCPLGLPGEQLVYCNARRAGLFIIHVQGQCGTKAAWRQTLLAARV